jgi:hypothetical protein
VIGYFSDIDGVDRDFIIRPRHRFFGRMRPQHCRWTTKRGGLGSAHQLSKAVYLAETVGRRNRLSALEADAKRSILMWLCLPVAPSTGRKRFQ